MSDSEEEKVIHVQEIPPQQRHSLIFMTFEHLAPGEAFVIVNDHNPIPLKRQFEVMHENNFGWDYLEDGPHTWRVRISRKAAG